MSDSDSTGFFEMEENANVLPTTLEHHPDARADEADEESVAVITQAAFETAGAILTQDTDKEPGEEDAPAPPQSPTIVRLLKEELGEWVQEKFQRATAGNETIWAANQMHLVTDRTNDNEHQTLLTTSDTGGCIQVIYGLAKLPTNYQMVDDTQIIACFAPR